jgi:hypothetical protein
MGMSLFLTTNFDIQQLIFTTQANGPLPQQIAQCGLMAEVLGLDGMDRLIPDKAIRYSALAQVGPAVSIDFQVTIRRS